MVPIFTIYNMEIFMSDINPNTYTPVVRTVNQFVENNPAFTHGGIRHLLFNKQFNGLEDSGAILRVGRKILINEGKFFAWLESQNNRG